MDNKILIVDDARFARKVMIRMLHGSNYMNIVEAKNAEEGMALFIQEKPDLTLLDISLPDSNDLDLLKRMIAYNPKAKIIMCSALAQNMIIMEAITIGAVDFISKPYTEAELIQAVTEHLSKRGE